ncbi:uncharacterized protein LOC122501412 [Leptopilina heterotoma]|uniref:uncharacterized protein LOC122501412 n=1 Tax=Leptopilina heterotoma TaxID=63436 RepID=UPI001CAA137B|nr:uncharacterized protein LOC122501412 [Leptopilina heterotoma]
MDNAYFTRAMNFCKSQHVDMTDLLDEKSYFFSNMCYICRCFGEKVNLKRCSACNMISYCSKEHQKQDWPNHKQFCRVLCQIKKDWKVDNLFESLKVKSADERMAVFKQIDIDGKGDMLIELLKAKAVTLLKRNLKVTELQMIQLPRVCSVCFESKQELLVNCKKCAQTSFCKEHLNNRDHQEECHKCIFSAIIIPQSICEMTKTIKLSTHIKIDKLPSSMMEFMETYVTKNSIDLYSVEAKDSWNKAFSDKYSRALSIIFAMEKLDFYKNSESLVIHLVGASLPEEFFDDWEILLHFFKSLRKLSVILIGDELISFDDKVEKLCKSCRKGNKKVIIETHHTLYDAYCGQSSFKKPDIIVCFNAGLYSYDSWEKSVRVFNKGQCPLVVTAYTKAESLEDEKMVKSIFPCGNCVYSDCNPFESFTYTRLRIGLSINSSSNFIFIYKHLGENITSK